MTWKRWVVSAGTILLLLAGALLLTLQRPAALQAQGQQEEPGTVGREFDLQIEGEPFVVNLLQVVAQELLDQAVSDGVIDESQAAALAARFEARAEIPLAGRLPRIALGGAPIGHGQFFGVLMAAQQRGLLTHEQALAIMNDFAEIGGTGVSFEVRSELGGAPFGSNGERIELYIGGDYEPLREAFATALDNAVDAGILEAQDAAEILQELDELERSTDSPRPGGGVATGGGSGPGAPLEGTLTVRVDGAVEGDRIARDTADDLLPTIEEILR